MRSILSIAALCALAACATEPASAPAQAAATPAVQVADAAPLPQECHREVGTGSNVPHTVCAPAATADERMTTREGIQRMIGNTGLPPSH